MVKQILNYTFNASAKQITFTDFTTIALDRIITVVNATVNIPVYVPNTAGYGGTVGTNVLTFTASNAGMNNTDKLIIKYELKGTDVGYDNTITGVNENGLVKTLPIITSDGAAETSPGVAVKAVPNLTKRTSFTKNIANDVDTDFFTKLQLGTGMTLNQINGNLIIDAGTTANSETILRSIFTVNDSFTLRYLLNLTQRIANNNFFVEMVDLIGDSLAMSNISTGTYTATKCYWTRSTTTATLYCPNHMLTSTDSVTVANSTDITAVVNGATTVTVVNQNTVTFTCLNAGAAFGFLDYTTPSKPTVDVTIPGTTWTSANVGQALTLGFVNNGTGGSTPLVIPTEYRINAVSGTTVTLLGPTGSATGTFGTDQTCSLFGWNFIRAWYDGVTATSWKVDTQRNGFNNSYNTTYTGATAVTHTTALTGQYAVITVDDGEARIFDSSGASSTSIGPLTARASRFQNTPDNSIELYLQVRVVNSTSAPASNSTAFFGLFLIEDFTPMAVSLMNSRTAVIQPVSIFANQASTTVQEVVGDNADASTTLAANPVIIGGKDTGAVTRTAVLSDGGGVTGPGEIISQITAFSAGSATPAEGTNSKTVIVPHGREADVYFGCFAQGNAANTIQIEGSVDGIIWNVIPMTRTDGIVTTALFAQLGTWTPTSNATYRGKSYGYSRIRVHQTARTTTGTSGVLRVVPTPEISGVTLSAFTFDAQNTTEAVGTASGVLMSGGVRTLQVTSRGSAKAILTIDAFTYATAVPTSSTLLLEGSIDGTNYVTLPLQPLGGGPILTSGITGTSAGSTLGSVAIPIGGVWEADVSQQLYVRARWSAYTAGSATVPRYHGSLKIVNVPAAPKSITTWSYAAPTSGIVDTTNAVTIKAAAGTGLYNYINNIQLFAEAISNETEFCIRDGAGGTVLWRIKIPTTGMPFVSIPVDIKSSANTLLEIVTLTASGTGGGGVYFNCQGYVSTF